MLWLARSCGVDTIDTASGYGESEGLLGKLGLAGLRVYTKLASMPAGTDDIAAWVRRSIEGSFARLQLDAVAGVLLHKPSDLFQPGGDIIYRTLETMRDQGLVGQVGYSIYYPEELELLVARFPAQVVQVPFNVFDQRFAQSGWLQRLQESGVEVHTRSTFLQGLLLMDSRLRPTKFDRWASQFERWDRWVEHHQVTPLQAALCHALHQPGIDRVVVGATSVVELQQILSNSQGTALPSPENVSVHDEELINPSLWSRL